MTTSLLPQSHTTTSGERPTIGGAPGVRVELLDLGATISRLEVPDARGGRRNVVLGYDTAEEYCSGSILLGGVIGRNANRIDCGRCTLDGSQLQLDTRLPLVALTATRERRP